MGKYHAMSDQVEDLSRLAFGSNFLAEGFRSIFNTCRPRNARYNYSFATGLFERFFDSPPIMNRCERRERKWIRPSDIYRQLHNRKGRTQRIKTQKSMTKYQGLQSAPVNCVGKRVSAWYTCPSQSWTLSPQTQSADHCPLAPFPPYSASLSGLHRLYSSRGVWRTTEEQGGRNLSVDAAFARGPHCCMGGGGRDARRCREGDGASVERTSRRGNTRSWKVMKSHEKGSKSSWSIKSNQINQPWYAQDEWMVGQSTPIKSHLFVLRIPGIFNYST